MTHYMELLATNQPWNLLFFMAIPVILAETLAISEFALLFSRNYSGGLRRLNRWTGMLLGFYFLGVFIYLFANAVMPITSAGAWRGAGDVIAVGAYLLGVVPLFAIALLELGVLDRGSQEENLKLHVTLVAAFLIVAHVAMIFGMVTPSDAMPMPMSQ
jgi:hypothetical protein